MMVMTMTPFLDHLQSPVSTRPLGAFSLHDSSLPMPSAPVTASKPGPRATLTSTASCALPPPILARQKDEREDQTLLSPSNRVTPSLPGSRRASKTVPAPIPHWPVNSHGDTRQRGHDAPLKSGAITTLIDIIPSPFPVAASHARFQRQRWNPKRADFELFRASIARSWNCD